MGVACCPGRRLRRNKRGPSLSPPISVGYPSLFSSVPAGSQFVVLRCAPIRDPSTPQPNPARFSQNAAAAVQAWCSENGSASHSSAHFIQKRQMNTQQACETNAACIFGCRRKHRHGSFSHLCHCIV
jgi:hypothetical protein